MKYKQREHTTIGDIDHYKTIDQYIPTAIQEADARYPDKSIAGYDDLWSAAYCWAMDRMLVKEGLRVL